MQTTPQRLVSNYYKLIDQQEIEHALEVFSTKTTYTRGATQYKGFNTIKDFYLNKRKLLGVHTISNIHQKKGGVIIVLGTFTGTNSLNERVSIQFKDEWVFDEENLLTSRTTSFPDNNQQKIQHNQ